MGLISSPPFLSFFFSLSLVRKIRMLSNNDASGGDADADAVAATGPHFIQPFLLFQ